MPKMKATFIEPMLLLGTEELPQGTDWLYEIKLDGYRALAIKSGGQVQLRSRNDCDFTERYCSIAAALCTVPDETVLDGELTPLDEEGRLSFHLLQNYVSSKAALVFFIFDVLILRGRNVMTEALSDRRALLEKHVLPKLVEPIRHSPELKAGLPQLPSAAMNDLVVREKRSHRTAMPAPRFAAAGWSYFKAQRCLEVSSIHRNAGLGFLRVTNEHNTWTIIPSWAASGHRRYGSGMQGKFAANAKLPFHPLIEEANGFASAVQE